MKWYFQPPPEGDVAEQDDDDDSASGLLGLPAVLLERHGARILDPGRAGEVHGYPRPRPTVYRARTLLVPGDLLRNISFIDAVNDVLERAGMMLVVPEEDRNADLPPDRSDQQQEVFEALRQLPRPVVLIPRQGYRRPVEIDAWMALQTLHAATGRGTRSQTRHLLRRRRVTLEQVTLDKAKVDRIGLRLASLIHRPGAWAGRTPQGVPGRSKSSVRRTPPAAGFRSLISTGQSSQGAENAASDEPCQYQRGLGRGPVRAGAAALR